MLVDPTHMLLVTITTNAYNGSLRQVVGTIKKNCSLARKHF
jgi:hypothetical protein